MDSIEFPAYIIHGFVSHRLQPTQTPFAKIWFKLELDRLASDTLVTSTDSCLTNFCHGVGLYLENRSSVFLGFQEPIFEHFHNFAWHSHHGEIFCHECQRRQKSPLAKTKSESYHIHNNRVIICLSDLQYNLL